MQNLKRKKKKNRFRETEQIGGHQEWGVGGRKIDKDGQRV